VLRANTVGFRELGADLGVLCVRLSRQWGIECTFQADLPEVAAPMRLHLDSHHLVREAVANAVRHARAKSVDVRISSDSTNLLLEVVNDGTMQERAAASSPWSLRERVDEANGSLMLASSDNRTTVSITLPLT
jgi:signal transduction histidine kinase